LAGGELGGFCGCGKGYLSLGLALLFVQALLGLLDLVEVGLHELELGLEALQLFTRFKRQKLVGFLFFAGMLICFSLESSVRKSTAL